MVTVGEASHIIFNHLTTRKEVVLDILDCRGKVLAESILADRDFPPFDRVSMDGIAIQFSAWQSGIRSFSIEGLQAAGQDQKQLRNGSNCIEVMTGAVLPGGCDTVIRYEDVRIEDKRATVETENIGPGQSIHKRSADARRNDTLLEPGLLLTPAEVALLASVGKSKVNVYAYPKAAIISTGDELVDIDQVPKNHQIRSSNTFALQSAMAEMGWQADRFHVEDDRLVMEQSLRKILGGCDVLILSGGVSKGKFDFVPGVLKQVGFEVLFHQVSQRPGKPFWFGKTSAGKVAFALPGNPVSTFMCFYKYIKPWILKSLGIQILPDYAILAEDFSFTPNLTYFLQVSVKKESGRMMAYPVAGGGSGDFANLKNVTGFLELPLGKNVFNAGEVFPYLAFRH
jgi:molybdopterin molybdotransferase